MDSYSNKLTLRAELLKKRMYRSEEESRHMAQQICARIVHWIGYMNSDMIAVYASFRNEVDMEQVVENAWEDGKRVVFPKSYPETKDMKFFEVRHGSELRKGAYGIMEPAEEFDREVDPQTIQLALVPGVGFDQDGYRLGYGAGYYDRFFAKFPHIIRVGISDSEHLLETVYPESHDCKMNYVCTFTKLFSL
ncbi:5-formyltetrahydrofolate cyclo-ligase [Croceifilum oryzae]|uniref:5-formyltetrahydrofolate cyclo-ligase n=1 Tax=Croceifilum oryzae TaxID=1553429 RepID=A0AAJ1TH82_9BACL|nr:5-formyltetrahydrofolate cyclo-ligase [Croceifilum oryzae]MDQ0418409.1 5-formyltetrahydrofolate cyclo-ligase [Croceifilum oryzae]